jgi:hypothetical protein
MKLHKNIICSFCKQFSTRYKGLKTHIEEDHPGEAVPEWVIKEASK